MSELSDNSVIQPAMPILQVKPIILFVGQRGLCQDPLANSVRL